MPYSHLPWYGEVDVSPRTITFSAASAILGGWLPIMAPAVVTIALRLGEFEATALDSTYALVLAAGWLAMIAALIAAGYASDAMVRRGMHRTVLVRVSIPLIALGGALMALAPSAVWLALVWALIQIPAALVIATALAEGGAHLREDPRSLVSGWAGAMPILALLIGAVGVRALSDSLGWAFIAPAFAGALLCVPLAMAPESRQESSLADRRSTSGAISGLWLAFLIASFLLAWTTSTVNGFLVVFVQEQISSTLSDIADISTLAVILASGLAVVASVGASRLAHGRGRPIRMWWAAAGVCAAGLAVLVIAPSTPTLLLVAAVFGIAFGVANGVELAVVVAVRGHDESLGRDMGLLTAVTSMPYVLVPAVAVVALADSARTGVVALFIAAAATAIVAMVVLASRSRTSVPAS